MLSLISPNFHVVCHQPNAWLESYDRYGSFGTMISGSLIVSTVLWVLSSRNTLSVTHSSVTRRTWLEYLCVIKTLQERQKNGQKYQKGRKTAKRVIFKGDGSLDTLFSSLSEKLKVFLNLHKLGYLMEPIRQYWLQITCQEHQNYCHSLSCHMLYHFGVKFLPPITLFYKVQK